MALIRLISFALIAWLLWRMFKNYQNQKANTTRKTKILEQKKMVKCQFCSLHIPKQEAISYNDSWFCNMAHQNQYLKEDK